MRFGQTLQIEEPNFRGSGVPRRALPTTIPRGAVLQHRAAAATRPGAGVAGQNRRGVPPGMDRPVLRPRAAARSCLGLIDDAHRHLEHQLDPCPDRPARPPGWPAATSTSLAIQETKIAGREVPARPARRPRLPGRAPRHQPVERRRGAVQGRDRRRPDRVPGRAVVGRPGGRRGAGGRVRCAAACGCGACTCPTAGRSATRTTTTSWSGSAALRDYGAKELAADPTRADRVLRRLQHRADRRRHLERRVLPALDARDRRRSGRPSTSWSPPASPTSSGRTPPAPASTPTGTTPSWPSRSAAACGSTSRWPAPRWRRGSRARSIDREERKGKGCLRPRAGDRGTEGRGDVARPAVRILGSDRARPDRDPPLRSATG